MKFLAKIACVLLLTVCVLAQSKGIEPRSKPSDFPASAAVNGVTLAAAQLSNKQVEHAFATGIDERYVVLEVAFYPERGEVTIDPASFLLYVDGTKTVLRPVSPRTVAAVLQKPTGKDVTLYPTAGVGYETGGGVYGGHQSGVMTGVGLGVGVSPKEQKSDADRKVMETELSEKVLPSGTFTKPVSGYLYFPISTAKAMRYLLEYRIGELALRVMLPAPQK